MGPFYSQWLCFGVRSLEWEALSAGLFGLAGGVSVVAVSRIQIREGRRAFAESQLIDVDALIRQYEIDIPRVRSLVMAAIWNVRPDDPRGAAAANNYLGMVGAVMPSYKLLKIVSNQYRLPESLRIMAGAVAGAAKTIQGIKFGILTPNIHSVAVENTRQLLRILIQEMEQGLENLKVERDEHLRLLVER